MKPPIASKLSLTFLLAASSALAQVEPPSGTGRPSLFSGRAHRTQTQESASPAPQATATAPVKSDTKVFPAQAALPEPTKPDEIKPATIALPADAIEPWLLSRDNGPFMVLARTFRGPEAERFALALAMELRRDYGLPAYILRTKDFPGKSVMRNVPPLAPPEVRQARLADPERVRSFDEAAVLVGDEKTLAGSEKLLHRVKKIQPKCLSEMPTIFNWRSGLSTALRTTNPYVPTQDLFPGRHKRDIMMSQMNSGPRSIYHCPGRYTLQVAEFNGRSILNPSTKDPAFFDTSWLKKSPLVTAADDAERLADALSKDPEIQRTGAQAYVYHSRTTSKVLIGSFNDPRDPAAVQLRETLLKNTRSITERYKSKNVMIAPANQLTDLEDPNNPVKSKQ
jgi:hypothetical protein